MHRIGWVATAGLVGCLTALTACSSAPAPDGKNPRASATVAAAVRPSTATTTSPAKPLQGTATSSPRPIAAAPRPTPCGRNTKPKKIIVSVPQQHAWMCAHTKLVYSTAVTTGAVDLAYDATPTGSFAIQSIDRNQVLTLLSGAQYSVKYWIPFDGPLFGFHDSSWQKMPYGSQKYRTKGSHGCIHTPLPALKFLASWATVGTSVRIKAQ